MHKNSIGYCFKDNRILENPAIINKIRKQLASYEDKLEARFLLSGCIFIINFETPQQVLINFPVYRITYFGEFVLIAEVEGYDSIEDIITFFTTDSSNKVKIVNPDKGFPFFFRPKAELNTKYPDRFASSGYMQNFLVYREHLCLQDCTLFYEDHSPLNKLEMCKIHLVIRDLNNHDIYNSSFQDSNDLFLGHSNPMQKDNQGIQNNSIYRNIIPSNYPRIKSD